MAYHQKLKTSAAFVLLMLLITILAAFVPVKTIKISGHINGLTTGMAYLSYPLNGADVTDSAKVANGNFEFTESYKEPVLNVLTFSGLKSQLQFFSSEGSIKIEADKDALYKAVVTGSAVNDNWKEYLKGWKEVTACAGAYYHKADSVNKVYNGKPDSAAKASLKEEYKKLTAVDLKFHRAFFEANPSSVICPYVINIHYIPYFQFDEARQLFALLNPVAKNSYYGKLVEQSFEIEKRSGIGARPDFTMAGVNGKPVKLSSFRGRYVLVDFWASWCGPCRRENPNVVANYKKYHDKGFDVLGVSLDRKKEPWIKAIEADGLNWTHVSDLKGWKNAAAEEFGVKVVPSNFLLDKEGRVIAKNIREKDLSNKLRSIFNY